MAGMGLLWNHHYLSVFKLGIYYWNYKWLIFFFLYIWYNYVDKENCWFFISSNVLIFLILIHVIVNYHLVIGSLIFTIISSLVDSLICAFLIYCINIYYFIRINVYLINIMIIILFIFIICSWDLLFIFIFFII